MCAYIHKEYSYSIIHNNQKNKPSKCLSTEWIGKWLYIQIIEYKITMKKTEQQ
jgi:hypothetical protein